MGAKIGERLSAEANKLLGDSAKKTVLEAGCGSASYFTFNNVSRMVGIDINEDQLKRNTILDERILGNLESYPLPEARFDIVVCWDVIEHLSHPEDALRNIFNAVKPGGLVILGFPHLLSFKGLVTKATPFWFHKAFYRHMNYSSLHFPTYFRLAIIPSRIVKLAETCNCSVASSYLYEGGVTERLRKMWFVKIPFKLIDSVWQILTIGKYNSLLLDNCALVLKKGNA